MTQGTRRTASRLSRCCDSITCAAESICRWSASAGKARFRLLLCALSLLWVLVAATPIPTVLQAPPGQPANLAVLHRSGQTFNTWTERADLTGERYRIYRHTQPITAGNLAQATRLYEVSEGSGRFFADRYNVDYSGVWQARYVDRFVITDGGSQLSAGAGLLVWTLAPEDFGGGDGLWVRPGNGYYAVTTVDSNGVENTGTFGAANSIGPVAERVDDPVPVEILTGDGGLGHVYVQYMDLRDWNPTFHAPHAANGYYGLDPGDPGVAGAIQYAYTYTVGEPDPANCGGSVPARLPVIVNLHGWADNTYGPDATATAYYCAFEVRPVDISQTWYFGFARNHDYRQSSTVGAGDTIVNYTEQRILRMIYDLLRDPDLGPRLDRNRIYVWGHSMGGSGALALALRYPNVFAAAYASEPMTNYRTAGDGGGVDWRDDVTWKWGSPALNLPVQIGGPGDWADHLQAYDGTGVWDWQNHQANVQSRLGDETVPFGVGHGRSDTVIEWATQGQPAYAAFNAGRRAWGGAVTDDDHTWLGFNGLPPTLAPDPSLAPFAGFQVVLNESVPGLSNASGDLPLPPPTTGGYNQTIDWSASWNAWDSAPTDTATQWRISLRTTDGSAQTVDVTPRRLQQFRITPGSRYAWENRRVGDNSLVASGTVTADDDGLVTVPGFLVSPGGNRLTIWPLDTITPTATPSATPTRTATPTMQTASPTPGGTPTAGECVRDANSNGQGDVVDIMTAARDARCLVYLPLVVGLWRQPWPTPSATLTPGLTASATPTPSATVRASATPTATRTSTPSPTLTNTLDCPGQASTATPGSAARRSWPDSSGRILVFNDQLAGGLSDAQFTFAATHYVGTQKMTRHDADHLRAANPDFLILHYRLGMGLGYRATTDGCQPIGDWLMIIEGDEWVREWPGEAAVQPSWFFPWAGQPRVFHCPWGWYLMELDDPGWRAYWAGEVLRQIRANDDDGVFMDSLSVPNYLGADTFAPPLPAVDATFEAAWSRRIADWLTYLQTLWATASPRPYLVPNVGSWVTTRDVTDYSAADGVMIEGFGYNAWTDFGTEDWALQMDRALAWVRTGRALIAQSYVDAVDVDARLFSLSSYLLIQGPHTYVNLDLGLELEWFPEYAIDLGAPVDPLPDTIAGLRDAASGAYVRRFARGRAIVNPGPGTATVNLGTTLYRVVPVGGGLIGEDGLIPSAWRLTFTPVTAVTLASGQAAILLTTGGFVV